MVWVSLMVEDQDGLLIAVPTLGYVQSSAR
jgi:hypothetical protein